MGSVLNDDITVATVPEYVRNLYAGPIERCRLEAGMKLFTVCKERVMAGGAETKVTQYWTPFDRHDRDPGLRWRLDTLSSNNRNAEDRMRIMRQVSAACNEYKPKVAGRYAVIAKLQKPVIGFCGTLKRGEQEGGMRVPNGLRYVQIYAPNLLAGDHISRVEAIDLMATEYMASAKTLFK